MNLALKKKFVIAAPLCAAIVCGSVLLYFSWPQRVLPGDFDTAHVRSVTVSVSQPWVDKTLRKEVDDAAGITAIADAVRQLRYNRGSRHSEILGGGWSIQVVFSMNDGTSVPVCASASGSGDAVEVLFPDGEKYYGTWPGIQLLWDSLNYPVQEG